MKSKIDKIQVDNLKCGGCAHTIEQTLLKLNGVSDVIVKVELETVEVSHDLGTTREQILLKLRKMGYPEKDTSTLLQKGKSYISCAIGKVKKQL